MIVSEYLEQKMVSFEKRQDAICAAEKDYLLSKKRYDRIRSLNDLLEVIDGSDLIKVSAKSQGVYISCDISEIKVEIEDLLVEYQKELTFRVLSEE